MIRKTSLLEIIKEDLLTEALPLSIAKQYTSIKVNPAIGKKIDNIFRKLSQLPGATQSKRGDRIYIEYTGDKKTRSQAERDIEYAISAKGYKIKDYLKGIAIDPYGREQKLGKVLTKLKLKDLLHDFNTGKDRASRTLEDVYLVFSRHPYDIAGAATDRAWKSCMTIYKGELAADYLHLDVSEGTFVVYIITKDDFNINKPSGRVSVKPFINIRDPKDVIFSTSASMTYGNVPDDFRGAVQKILDSIQNYNTGIFSLDYKLYCDTTAGTFDTLPKIGEKVSRRTVEKVLDILQIENYEINDDLTVSVDGDVEIDGLGLSHIPIQFNIVTGDFICTGNLLKSLKGSPFRLGGNFECSMNDLETLEGSPQEMANGSFYCDTNVLKSLKGVTQDIFGDFDCSGNEDLESLSEGPKKVGGDYICQGYKSDEPREKVVEEVRLVTEVGGEIQP